MESPVKVPVVVDCKKLMADALLPVKFALAMSVKQLSTIDTLLVAAGLLPTVYWMAWVFVEAGLAEELMSWMWLTAYVLSLVVPHTSAFWFVVALTSNPLME